jgi:hypothetical protein
MTTTTQQTVQNATKNLVPAFVTFEDGAPTEFYSEQQVIEIMAQEGRWGMVELIQKIGLEKAWKKVQEWEESVWG